MRYKMEQNINQYLQNRYTCKAYDKSKVIPTELIEQIKETLRLSVSSTNIQPWSFILASTDEGKAKIAKSAQGAYIFNQTSMLNASHIVVFCAKTDVNEEYLQFVLSKEDADGRFNNNPEFKEAMHKGRSMFSGLHRDTFKDLPQWLEKQVYINLGTFITAISVLGIDSTVMEGFDSKILDEEFNLPAKGLKSLIVVPIGYSDEEKDFNRQLPKSRLEIKDIIQEI